MALMLFQNRPDNRQSQPGSAIRPGPGLVDFIKAEPDILNGCFGNGVTGVKYGESDLALLDFDVDAQQFKTFDMLEGVVDVIDHDLFDTINIRPDIGVIPFLQL